ncbi:MAG: uncharacterized membrane protein YqaE (UPF0057 family) [Crocinitomicaceae bacterium]|jgi:uncharacterized membrane protein YqaE (UPF0057 family)
MKRLNIIYLFLAMTIVLASCGSSNNVVSNKLISKRKYNKGFHINKKGNYKNSNEDVAKNENTDKTERKKFSDRTKSSNAQQEVSRVESSETAPMTWEAEESEFTVGTAIVLDGAYAFEVTVDEPVSVEDLDAADAAIEREQSKKDMRKSLRKKVKGSESSGWGADAMFILAVIFAILIPPLGVAIYTNIDWMKVLIALLLTILFVLPGMIYALLVVFDVI